MPIPVQCSSCGRRFRAPDNSAGKKTKCPICAVDIQIPAIEVPDDDEELRLAEPEPRTPAPSVENRPLSRPAIPPANASPAQSPSVGTRAPFVAASGGTPPNAAPPQIATPAKWVPPTKSATPDWLRHLHWGLALALIPLAFSVLLPAESPEQLRQRFLETLLGENAGGATITADASSSPAAEPASAPIPNASPSSTSPPQSPRSSNDNATNDEGDDGVNLDALFSHLPGHKLKGALLARDSYLHWLFALLAIALFLTFLVFLSMDGSAQPLHLLGIGAFTATLGIALLLALQLVASWVPTVRLRRMPGVVMLIYLLLVMIAFSYNAASDPEMSFIPSFLGYTLGVGLCEELCKALPLLVHYNKPNNRQSWRGAFHWGLASGIGFGVSEGIMYSQSYYNGIQGGTIYLVRFLSCVALHAVWTGSVGISINQRQYLLHEEQEEEGWLIYLFQIVRLISIPMVLHGLYDTLLKKDMELVALLTAFASFGYLAWQIATLRQGDDDDERAAYVASYIRERVKQKALA